MREAVAREAGGCVAAGCRSVRWMLQVVSGRSANGKLAARAVETLAQPTRCVDDMTEEEGNG